MFFDSLRGPTLTSTFWSVNLMGGANGSAQAQSDGLHVELTAANPSDWFAVRVYFLPAITGDFDASVDYQLATWPVENGTRITMGSGLLGAVERASLGGAMVSRMGNST